MLFYQLEIRGRAAFFFFGSFSFFSEGTYFRRNQYILGLKESDEKGRLLMLLLFMGVFLNQF